VRSWTRCWRPCRCPAESGATTIPALTDRLALLAVLGALVAAVVDPSVGGILAAAALVLAVAAVDLLLAASPARLHIEREPLEAVRLGESATTTLRIVNSGPRRVRGLLRDAWVPSAGSRPAQRPVDIPAGQARFAESTLTPTRRGLRRSDRVTVRCRGPLGLACRQRSRTVPGVLRVLPAFSSRRHLPARLAVLRELDGRSPVAIRGAGTEFDTLRGYIPGDDVRSIDWRGSARGGGVVVRTWRPEQDRVVEIVLDCGRTSAGRLETDEGPTTRLDLLLDAALLLGALAGHAGDRVGVCAVDAAVRAELRPSRRRTLGELSASLLTVEPRLVETDHALLARTVLTRVPRRALLVLLTGLDGPVITEGLLPVLGTLTARHHVLLGAVSDPETARAASSLTDAGSVYLAAAAAREELDRAATAERLRSAGVTVIDATPATLAPRLADAYLELKRTGRL
jgi:uncharacterized protein (DUF58 family)